MPLPKVPQKFLPKLTSVFLLLYVAATLPLLANRLTSFAYMVQAVVQKKQNAENEATESLKQAIQPNFWDATIYKLLGLHLSDRGKVEEAISAYRQAIRLYPEDDSAYRDLGKALIDRGKSEEAIATYRQAIKVNPQWTWAYNELGNTLYNKSKFDEAIAAYRQAIQIDPKYAAAYDNLGNTLYLQGKLDEAIATYRQGIKVDPQWAWTHNRLGKALFEKGKFDEAIAAYRQGIKIDPNDAEACKNLGLILQQQGRLEEAIASYRQGIKINLKKVTDDSNSSLSKFSASYQNISLEFLLKEAERLLAVRKKPQLTVTPERLPSLKDEPLISLKRSFVRVIIKSSPQLQSRTGWVVKRQGNKAWIVTTRPVETADKNTPQSDRSLEVEFYSKPLWGEFRKRLPAKIAKITDASNKLDLALLEVTDIPKDIQPPAISSASLALNSPIQIIGYPDTADVTVAKGKVINQTNQELKISEISAMVYPGSPVLDQQNRVVAMLLYPGSYTMKIPTNKQAFIISGSAVALPSQSVIKQLKDWGID